MAAARSAAGGAGMTPPPSVCVWCGCVVYAVGGGVWVVEGGGVECDRFPFGVGRHAPRHEITRRGTE